MKKIIVSLLATFAVIGAVGSVAYAKEVDVWDGTVDTSWYNETDTVFTIDTAEEFAGFAYLVNGAQSFNPALENEDTADFGYYTDGHKSARPTEAATANSISFEGKTVKLACDLDLCAVDENGKEIKLPGGEQLSMMPVGYSKYTPFMGTFDGQGHTISNLFQGGWDMYGLDYKNVYVGLFGCVEDATIKNLVIDNFAFNCEMNLGGVAAISGGETTFDNITVQNSTIATGGGWWVGGIVGWANGNQTFKNITIDETTTIAQTGGHYDTAVGGIVGGCNNVDGETMHFEDCTVACKLDVYNDCVANYDTNSYRNCGMIIGGIGEDNEIIKDGKKYPDMAAKGITFENVTVVIGDWANYTYCYSYELSNNCQRIEAGVGYKGVDVTKLEDYSIEKGRTFDAIIGAENAGDLSNVRGAVDVDVMAFLEIEGINVTDEAIVARNEVMVIHGETSLLSEVKLNNTYYETIEEALENVVDGDTIVLLKDVDLENANIKNSIIIDLKDYTLTIDAVGIMDGSTGANAAIQAWNDVTIANGNIEVICDEKINNGVFYVASSADAVLTLSNVEMNVENTTGTEVFVVCNPGVLNIAKSEINAKNVDKLINGGDEGVANITASEINVADSERVLLNVVINATDSDFVASNIADNAFRNVTGTIVNTNVDINGSKNGIKNDNGTLTVSGESTVIISGADVENGGSDIVLGGNSSIVVEGNKALLEVETSTVGENASVTTPNSGTYISKTDLVYIQYKKADVDAAGNDTIEDADEYFIILAANTEKKINELASADITFKFTPNAVAGGAMDYVVKPAAGVTLTQLGTTDRYMFNYNGVDKYEETGAAIVIGTVTISGYGTYGFETANVETNAVYATEIRDNIVEGFEANGKLVIDDNDKFSDMDAIITGKEILVPTRKLIINIDFPNSVNTENAYVYQNMTVKVSGGDLETELVVKLGAEADITDLDKFIAKNSAKKLVTATPDEDKYVVVVTDLLTLNTAYNVEVSGAGYRTARYTVTMTEDKVLNFWNNVKDNAIAIEEGKNTMKTNFLAGDIVKDNNINIYDLSAVVSYFGETGLSAAKYPEYAKYDLNRDGKIDSKDVAYVLVSWNN